MNQRQPAERRFLPIVCTALLLTGAFQVWQPTSAARAQQGGWTPPRTAWGDLDFQGVWNSKTLTPLERAAKYEGREFLTDQEVVELEKANIEDRGRDNRAERGSVADVEGAYNNAFSSFWGSKIVRTKRTSLIIDPPDGRLPALTPAGNARRAAARRTATTEGGPVGIADNPEERRNDACPGVTLPCTSPLCAFTRIVQTPGSMAIYYEAGHHGGIIRHIPLDGRPHLPTIVRQQYGDPVGRWEGNTLVVDTTNFDGRMVLQSARENLHLVERFTRTDPNTITYRATAEDPTTFTKPWTIEMTWVRSPDRAIYDEALCHEGNYAMTSILKGARELEKEKPARTAKPAARTTK
jgi:hypothetical protein